MEAEVDREASAGPGVGQWFPACPWLWELLQGAGSFSCGVYAALC